jgi:chromosome partitioning protein
MIINIAHSKGGCGKSLLTLNLAPLFKDLVLIDLDTQNSITEINQVRAKKHKIKSATNENEFFDLIDKYEDKNIIIDCGGIDSDINRLVVVNSDILIVPVKDNSFEILAFKRYLKVLDKLVQKNPDLKVIALINNVHHSSNDFDRLKDLISKYDFVKLADTIIRQRADYANLLEEGTTVVEKSKNQKSDKATKATKEIKELYKEIKRVING